MELHLSEENDEQKSRIFLRHLGLDRTNLHQMIQLDREIIPQSNQNYTWNDIYGKSPVLDLEQYIRDSTDFVKMKLDVSTKEVLKKIDEYLLPEIKRQRDIKFVRQLLDAKHPYGLRSLLSEEREQDYEYLVKMNRDTYEVLMEEKELASKEWRGIFGHREERVADLLSSVDDFIWQRYEICRCEAIDTIYQAVLELLENVSYSDITNERMENGYD